MQHKPTRDGHRIFCLTVLCLFGLCIVFGQKDSKTTKRQQDDRVYLIHSDELYYDNRGKNPEAQIVRGNVKFRHQGGFLTCDSAYFYQQQNSVRPMGHVHYWEADTFSLTCDRGFYDGQMQMMEARMNVVLKHNNQTLYTDSLNYDRIYENAYFYDGGKLVDGGRQLVSDWGTYNTATKKAIFYYNVVMVSDNQRVESDTLHYDTQTSVAHVLGPSVVIQDSTIVHTEDGYFDSDNDRSRLYGRSVINQGFKEMTGDSLFYDKTTGDAFGYGNVIYTDHENRNELHGDYVQYNEQTGFGYATIKAMLKDYSQQDTLFMHGDSIKLYTYNIDTDSVYRLIHCFNHVKAYRVDVQAVCDSLVGDSRDSCMTMYNDPIAWNGDRQVLGEVIKVYSNDSTIREAHVIGQAFSIEKCDEENHWNQVSSKVMDAYFIDGAVRRVDATGNVRAIYYPVDEEDSTLMLLNYTETDTLRIFLSPERRMEKIWTCKHVSDMYPMTQIPPEKYRLEKFAWFEELRPVDKDDIFHWRGKSEGMKVVAEKRESAPLQKLDKPVTAEEGLRKEDTKLPDSVAVDDSLAVPLPADSIPRQMETMEEGVTEATDGQTETMEEQSETTESETTEEDGPDAEGEDADGQTESISEQNEAVGTEEANGNCMGGDWEVTGRQMGGDWEVTGRCMGGGRWVT